MKFLFFLFLRFYLYFIISSLISTYPLLVLLIYTLLNRIIEIEWAVKNDKEFVPTPKRPRKAKKKKGGRVESAMEEDNGEESGSRRAGRGGQFGMELTNAATVAGSPSKTKRPLNVGEEEDGTPTKKQRMTT